MQAAQSISAHRMQTAARVLKTLQLIVECKDDSEWWIMQNDKDNGCVPIWSSADL